MEKNFKSWKTREVMVGNVGVGGSNPIRIQSMTTSPTHDVPATVDQILRLRDYGCEIARVTVQGMKEARACENIKNELVKKGCMIPLVADIHFYPPAALTVADFVDKVRINPGNFADPRATFKEVIHTDSSYADEKMRISEKFVPLVEKCIRLKRSMRIGVNHGSLSDRIMSRYGDTPKGMVVSAIEYTEIARACGYHDIIYSMKSSNPLVMIEAYRLLVKEMMTLGWDYPLHLGVTEAGEGVEGRVKSSIGIGSLLADGIGDTIRISLTEDPWFEIDPAQRLVRFAKSYESKRENPPLVVDSSQYRVEPKSPLHRDGTVVLSISSAEIESEGFFADLGTKMLLGRIRRTEETVDMVLFEDKNPTEIVEKKLALIEKSGIRVIRGVETFNEDEKSWQKIIQEKPSYICFAPTQNRLFETRRFFNYLKDHHLKIPVLLRFNYGMDLSDLLIFAGAEIGSLLADGMGEGILLEGRAPLKLRRELAFNILQGARRRNFKTEFISCPGCGRTLFDLQKVAASIREKTNHLPGVKIAIMGCIVNGPGEMADADFGYVGSKVGKIDLYVGKKCVERDIAMDEAVDKLITLIKEQGRWVEKEVSNSN